MDKLCLANLNVFWGGLIAETLARLGVRHAVISPGSRSAPLTLAFATSAEIEAVPVLDERSAGFFALGLVRRTGKPVVLVCTSGTAGANYFPAVIEAQMSGLPLIVLTADRPPEMRDCASGQTIDQRKLFGSYAVWEHELALPGVDRLRYLRQTLRHAVRRSLTPLPGPVHLNVPFRDPLAPVESPEPFLPKGFKLDEFLAGVCPPQVSGTAAQFDAIEPHERGLIVAGCAQVENPAAYAETVFGMAKQLGWPVLADVLSPLRAHAPKEAPLVTNYHALLRDRAWAERQRPDFVLQFGDLPTSKILRTWLAEAEADTLIIDSSYRNLDSAHARTMHLRLGDDVYAEPLDMRPSPLSRYTEQWLRRDREFAGRIQNQLRSCESFFEGKIPWLLSRRLPERTPVLVAASMPVRDAELFWLPSERGYRVQANRGANGIDGTLSTALGLAHDGKPAVLLTGDLAFLHDSNGLLSAPRLRGSLTVILVNNGGGRIFENLPIREFDPPFEDYFATPQQVDFEKLAAAHGIEYIKPKDWPELDRLVSQLPKQGLRIIEVVTDPADDVPLRKELLGGDAANVSSQKHVAGNASASPESRERVEPEGGSSKKKSRPRRRSHAKDRPAPKDAGPTPASEQNAPEQPEADRGPDKTEVDVPPAEAPEAPAADTAKKKPVKKAARKTAATPKKKTARKAAARKQTARRPRRKTSSQDDAPAKPDSSAGDQEK
ncbi:2-succinyl-5-enolpyruvyl-6-hydroxy-3-cyclohexene-1-carboxylic-acid synthase [Ruficoccus sp. ZRK36]|uniref:2-succinyl-5-enolpyruvyl-6-hydroxy-3- cyclohexene-1-carboxylic-acid synthase n=1 Tax=Ruficoccus sp. ZRK36 TaxID=2866311 RepID=UPI001C72A0B1|nr:2-succinyl-5-enolpyruvyl-6-hydroxy-3-cyclohexene-1-carboxylic-acid synthase [Ruficoccus sp. ZRK36]QYY36380.1 2-succinyl-5-enolpyruvyl-6-hydroxy-3-cyclohexene-1-carboxylic-acid synthase [Ruficoccus sp. ZRK36]